MARTHQPPLLVWFHKEHGMRSKSCCSSKIFVSWAVLLLCQSWRRWRRRFGDGVFISQTNLSLPYDLLSISPGLCWCIHSATSSKLLRGLSWRRLELMGGRYVSYGSRVGSIWDVAIVRRFQCSVCAALKPAGPRPWALLLRLVQAGQCVMA